jgi:hypothetical protein
LRTSPIKVRKNTAVEIPTNGAVNFLGHRGDHGEKVYHIVAGMQPIVFAVYRELA